MEAPATVASPSAGDWEEDARPLAYTASQSPRPATGVSWSSGDEPLGADFSLDSVCKDNNNNKGSGSKPHDGHKDTDHVRVRYGRRFPSRSTDAVWLEGKRPLNLLDLPIDILKDIVKEVTHTNDLTSLALCHSALHRLAIPHIYSRFDIVWPDTTAHSEPRSGVDALTYGLATLVMAEEIFRHDLDPQTRPQDHRNRFTKKGYGFANDMTVRKRRGNHYAQFTKKFSLGNGPPEWVQEYLTSKESGKMLGTLVALALARMRCLETFVWDMPTGILRDVWYSLSSLGDLADCRLERVWVRWHNNRATDVFRPTTPVHMPMGTVSAGAQQTVTPNVSVGTLPMNFDMLDRVEHPNFSVLPPLKSLSVLDIDEPQYLDEMAVLIGNSHDRLSELRVGIARHALTRPWVMVWYGEDLQQIDRSRPEASCMTLGEKRFGGILGVLLSLVRDMRETSKPSFPVALPSPEGSLFHDESVEESSRQPGLESRHGSLPIRTVGSMARREPADAVNSPTKTRTADSSTRRTLRLDILELEQVPLCVSVLQKALDWTVLTSLTLLHCQDHEHLWKTLRRTFAPVPKSPIYPSPRRSSSAHVKKAGRSSFGGVEVDLCYSLRLKKIHTNTVSASLITFLKETLAPNSLEVLFLQDSRTYGSNVTINAIFRGPIRRHRGSLKKILIESSEKGSDGLAINSSRWRRWMLTREMLGFICSGKMSSLRELGAAVDYRDWHYFLQHLPCIPQVRSLYIPFIADHVHANNLDSRELALQILDIVALRPEVELCYVGITNKCYEILENRHDADDRPYSRQGSVMSGHGDEADSSAMEDDVGEEVGVEDDDGEHDEDADDDDVEDDDESTESEADDDEDDDSGDLNDTDSEFGSGSLEGRDRNHLRLREILFYDDKVAVFKARHGRL